MSWIIMRTEPLTGKTQLYMDCWDIEKEGEWGLSTRHPNLPHQYRSQKEAQLRAAEMEARDKDHIYSVEEYLR